MSVVGPSGALTSLRRRTFLTTGTVLAGGLAKLALPGPVGAAATQAPAAQSVLGSDSVYFEETGHTVSGAFWRYWQSHGLDAFGYPVTEPYEDGGVLNQYFQRARFELHPGQPVVLGLLGIEAGGAQPPPTNEDGSPAVDTGPGVRLIPETGHTVRGAFLPAYDRWRAVLGPPVGPELAVAGGYMQYFAHARLEWDPFGGTRLGLLGDEVAAQRGVDRTRVAAPAGVPTWREYVAAVMADETERRAFAARITGHNFLPGVNERWVVVSIPQQRVTAYEGTRSVFSDLCSTGAAYKGLSSKGMFSIYRRVANEIMDSTTIGYPQGHPKYYRLENVLYTQYYNGGEALHYAWWHNNFGQPMSFGCINLRMSTARWFWDWANIGTRVVVV
jgi:lipoprotein-anchoring transpeptidase ErfK/SrfK